jgi:signal recognition particle subunit SEC65
MMLKDRLRIEENLDVQIQEMKEDNHPKEIVLVKVQWEEIEVVIFQENQNKIKGTQIIENVVMKDNNPNMSAKKTEIAGILVNKNP